MRVRLEGLSQMDLNGLVGSRGLFNEIKGRYLVNLDDGRSVLVHPKNMMQIQKPECWKRDGISLYTDGMWVCVCMCAYVCVRMCVCVRVCECVCVSMYLCVVFVL